MSKMKINRLEDRLTIAKILVDNGYTVRQAREKRGKSNAFDYLIEYWPNGTLPPEIEGSNEN